MSVQLFGGVSGHQVLRVVIITYAATLVAGHSAAPLLYGVKRHSNFVDYNLDDCTLAGALGRSLRVRLLDANPTILG